MTSDGRALFHCLINPLEGDLAASTGPRTRCSNTSSLSLAQHWGLSINSGFNHGAESQGSIFPPRKALKDDERVRAALSFVWGRQRDGNKLNEEGSLSGKNPPTDLPHFHGLSQSRTG